MDVLNTTGGGLRAEAIVLAALFILGAVVIFAISAALARTKEVINAIGSFLFGVVICAIGVGFLYADGSEAPIRHEVTLRPGHVIDATKYEIVEQRGKIYVI
jgi:hypothetical protein